MTTNKLPGGAAGDAFLLAWKKKLEGDNCLTFAESTVKTLIARIDFERSRADAAEARLSEEIKSRDANAELFFAARSRCAELTVRVAELEERALNARLDLYKLIDTQSLKLAQLRDAVIEAAKRRCDALNVNPQTELGQAVYALRSLEAHEKGSEKNPEAT